MMSQKEPEPDKPHAAPTCPACPQMELSPPCILETDCGIYDSMHRHFASPLPHGDWSLNNFTRRGMVSSWHGGRSGTTSIPVME